jgi:hypothetical protein
MRTGGDGEDEREELFDITLLADGDPVAVLMPSERRWIDGVLHRPRDGHARVCFALRESLALDLALLFGVRRILH